MLRHVASAMAVLAAAVWLAAGDSGDSGTDKSAPPPPTLQCSAAQGVHYSVEHCNKTSKTILKVLINDKYNVQIPSAPPTPSPLPISTVPPTSSLMSTTASVLTTVSSIPTTTSKPSTTANPHEENNYYEEYGDINTHTSTEYPTDADDWDYMEQLVHTSREEEQILDLERARHPLIFHHKPEYPAHWGMQGKTEFHKFCVTAAEDDEENAIVSDGSFHPRYEEVPGVGMYRLHARPRTWEEARRTCEREGAQLAVANSREEAETLVEIHNRCPRIMPTHFNDYQYLGVHDNYAEGQWETISGYPLNETGYVNWAWNQPDNAHHEGENCLTMNRSGKFNDVPCWTELPFICEHA